MDWKTLRKDKLAKAASYRPPEEPQRNSLWGAVDRVGELWARFMTPSWWEKGMVIGTAVLLAVLAPMAVFAIAGGDDDGASAVVATSTDVPAVIGGAGTDTPEPTSTPKAVPNTRTPTTTPEPNREDCDEIQGTAYQSETEEEWFLDNCGDEEPDDADEPNQPDPQDDEPDAPPAPPARPTNTPRPRPTNTPVPQPSISAGQAASLAAGWINSNPAYAELDIAPSSCSPQQDGTGWRVACTGTTSGCVGSACRITIWVCVTSSSVRQC